MDNLAEEKEIEIMVADLQELQISSSKSLKDAVYEAAKEALLHKTNIFLIHNGEKFELSFYDALQIASFHEVCKKIQSLKNRLSFHTEAVQNLQKKIAEEEKFLQEFYFKKWKK